MKSALFVLAKHIIFKGVVSVVDTQIFLEKMHFIVDYHLFCAYYCFVMQTVVNQIGHRINSYYS